MFDLENAVENWCRSVAGKRRSTRGLDELKDHLYCEIEELKRHGYSDREAFERAIERVGDPVDLLGEYSKNRTLFDDVCEAEAGFVSELEGRSQAMSRRTLLLINVVYLVLFAIFTFSMTWIFKGSEHFDKVFAVIYVLSLVPLVILPTALRSSRSEVNCLRRIFSSGE